MKHTKGPWIKDEHVTSDSEGEITIVIFCPDGPGYGRVAQAYAECGRNTELNGNAHLIAAAPELLEALDNILNVHAYTGFVDDKALEQAENAIAKAKGE